MNIDRFLSLALAAVQQQGRYVSKRTAANEYDFESDSQPLTTTQLIAQLSDLQHEGADSATARRLIAAKARDLAVVTAETPSEWSRKAEAVARQILTADEDAPMPETKGTPAIVAWLIGDALADATRRQAQRDAEGLGDLEPVVRLLDRAASKLKWPKLRLKVDGQNVQLGRAGDRSRHPGAVNVTDGRGFENSTWFGRINRDGTFTASRKTSPEVIALLTELARDPEAVATAYGRETGACCMCGRDLTDARSTERGYGPNCAENWGLPWGGRSADLEYDDATGQVA